MEKTAVWNLELERLGPPLLQKLKYKEKKAYNRRQEYNNNSNNNNSVTVWLSVDLLLGKQHN